jgi:uncharacterized protein YebE (UPF0316 family)
MIYIIIFVLKFIESTLSTRQYQYMAFCNRKNATLLALLSCSMWIVCLKLAVTDGIWGLVIYTLAYTAGVAAGMKGKPLR